MFDSLLPVDAASVLRVEEFIAFIVVVTLCAGALTLVYRYIADNNDRDEREFASTIFILTIAIGLLVSIIKSAPAISFGLFGAMSIVRFRAQIKRPQRMIFIFMAAAIGVCCGAGQYLTTVLGTLVLSALTVASFKLSSSPFSRTRNATATAVEVVSASETKPAKAEGPAWSIDFLPASLADDRRYRILLVVDESAREVLAAIPETSFSPARVAGELDRLIAERGTPGRILSEAWPQLAAPSLAGWAKAANVSWKWLDDTSSRAPSLVAYADEIRTRFLAGVSYPSLLQVRAVLESWQQERSERDAPSDTAAERDDRAALAGAAPLLAIKAARKASDQPQTIIGVEPFAQRTKSTAGH